MKRLRWVAPIALLVLATACNGDDGSGTGTNDDGNGTATNDDGSGTATSDDGSADAGDGGGSELSEDQQAAVDQLLEIGEEEGLAFDVDCVEEQASQLPDEDAAAIVEAGPDGDVQLSAAGEAITRGLFDCIDNDAMVDRFIDELETSGMDVDEECVRDALDGVNIADVLSDEGGEGADSDPATAAAILTMMECLGDLGDLGNLEDGGG